jgi:hypothetical protein
MSKKPGGFLAFVDSKWEKLTDLTGFLGGVHHAMIQPACVLPAMVFSKVQLVSSSPSR